LEEIGRDLPLERLDLMADGRRRHTKLVRRRLEAQAAGGDTERLQSLERAVSHTCLARPNGRITSFGAGGARSMPRGSYGDLRGVCAERLSISAAAPHRQGAKRERHAPLRNAGDARSAEGLFERLREIGDQIVGVLDADG